MGLIEFTNAAPETFGLTLIATSHNGSGEVEQFDPARLRLVSVLIDTHVPANAAHALFWQNNPHEVPERIQDGTHVIFQGTQYGEPGFNDRVVICLDRDHTGKMDLILVPAEGPYKDPHNTYYAVVDRD